MEDSHVRHADDSVDATEFQFWFIIDYILYSNKIWLTLVLMESIIMDFLFSARCQNGQKQTT
jgi:hypothetical protein